RRTVAVIGQALNEYRDTAWAVSLIHDGPPVGATSLLAAPTPASTLDVATVRSRPLGLGGGILERRGGIGIAATHARRNLNILHQAGEFLATLGVDCCLFTLRGFPL